MFWILVWIKLIYNSKLNILWVFKLCWSIKHHLYKGINSISYTFLPCLILKNLIFLLGNVRSRRHPRTKRKCHTSCPTFDILICYARHQAKKLSWFIQNLFLGFKKPIWKQLCEFCIFYRNQNNHQKGPLKKMYTTKYHELLRLFSYTGYEEWHFHCWQGLNPTCLAFACSQDLPTKMSKN